jgi:uncharacterized membrane protein YdbT with pleckstrin-like domain
MPHSFHPFPIVGAIKLLVLAVLLSLLLSFSAVFLGGLSFFVLLLVWVATILKIIMIFTTARYQEIILEGNTITYITGVISKNRLVLPYPRITEAGFSQGFLQRIFGVGTL